MCRRLSSGVTLMSPLGLRTNGLPIAKGGFVRGELLPGVAVLRELCPLGEIRREVEPQEVAHEGPAVGHLLAAGDSG